MPKTTKLIPYKKVPVLDSKLYPQFLVKSSCLEAMRMAQLINGVLRVKVKL